MSSVCKEPPVRGSRHDLVKMNNLRDFSWLSLTPGEKEDKMEEPKISTTSITEKGSSYKRWVASEGIPIIEGFFIEDINKVPLEPWKRTGGLAARICLQGTGETNDAYICE